MSPYLALLGARVRVLLQYRAAAGAALGTRLFWGLIRVMIFDAFYRSTTAPQPLTPTEAVTYIWLGQAMLSLTLGRMDQEVRGMVRSGTVAYELTRPLDLYGLWFTRSLAALATPLLMQAGPVLAVAALFFGFQAPPSAAAGAGWVAATCCAALLSSAVATLMTISLLWTVSGDGVARLLPTLMYVFSGTAVPLIFFPDWARSILMLLPFAGMIDVPFRVYLGRIPPEGLLPALAFQLAWTAALVLLGRALLGRAAHRLVVQGG